MRKVSIAIAQFSPRLGEVQANLEQIGETIDHICSAQQVDLIILPELATTGYECGVRFTELAEQVPGPALEVLSERANRYQTYIVVGMAVKHKVESIVYDAAILIGRSGDVTGQHHKVHLRPEERPIFRNGFRFPVYETDFGMLGLLVGWDLAFPEAARCLALDGAELVAVPANWEMQYIDDFHAFQLARAIENSIFVAAANRTGDEVTYSFGGTSAVVGPRGETYAHIGEDESGCPREAYAACKIDLDLVKKSREELQIMQSRQPMAYRNVIKNY